MEGREGEKKGKKGKEKKEKNIKRLYSQAFFFFWKSFFSVHPCT
jgi:hypothetical protein